MSKLKLVAEPSFKATVEIPVAGGEVVLVLFTFKHKTKTQLDEFIKSREGKSDADSMMEMCSAWELEDEFNRQNVETLLENRIGAALATYRTYVQELVGARTKN